MPQPAMQLNNVEPPPSRFIFNELLLCMDAIREAVQYGYPNLKKSLVDAETPNSQIPTNTPVQRVFNPAPTKVLTQYERYLEGKRVAVLQTQASHRRTTTHFTARGIDNELQGCLNKIKISYGDPQYMENPDRAYAPTQQVYDLILIAIQHARSARIHADLFCNASKDLVELDICVLYNHPEVTGRREKLLETIQENEEKLTLHANEFRNVYDTLSIICNYRRELPTLEAINAEKFKQTMIFASLKTSPNILPPEENEDVFRELKEFFAESKAKVAGVNLENAMATSEDRKMHCTTPPRITYDNLV
jgi:hypothetical protein